MSKNKKTFANFGASKHDILKELESGKVMLDRPTSLPLDSIKYATGVLQPRTLNGERSLSDEHIKDLVKLIKDSDTHLLDPVVVWWSGKNWRCLDGHHRLVAYKEANSKLRLKTPITDIPVEVFVGSFDEAHAHAIRLNNKIKLNMSFEDRMESTWQQVCLDTKRERKLSEIAALTKVSVGLVEKMRRYHRMLLTDETLWEDTGFQKVPRVPEEISWNMARQIVEGRKVLRDYGDAEMKAEAKALGYKLRKTCGAMLSKKPTITALALREYSRQLPKVLIQEFLSRGLISSSDLEAVQKTINDVCGEIEEWDKDDE